jgi:hypothetical protein
LLKVIHNIADLQKLVAVARNYSRRAACFVKSVVAVAAEEVDLGPLVVHQGLPGESIGLITTGAAVLARVGIAHVLACSGQNRRPSCLLMKYPET